MPTSRRLILVLVLVLGLGLAGCGAGPFLARPSSDDAVNQVEVVRILRYLSNDGDGPLYTVRLTVPESWVGKFETRSTGNSLTFFYKASERELASIFTIEALSELQYWQQIGSYPGQYNNLAVTLDTYFIYWLPRDPYFSGLPAEKFRELAQAVPDIVKTFRATPAQ